MKVSCEEGVEMKGKKLSVKLAAAVMALLLLPANFLLAGCGEKREKVPSANVLTAAQTQAEDANFPETVAAYDFSAGTEEGLWQSYNNIDETQGMGLWFAGGFKEVAQSYSIENPLKGKVQDGFSVVLHVTVAGTINHYESMFGFSDNTDPSKITKFFNVSGSGKGVHLNRVADGGTYAYYDITRPAQAPEMLEMDNGNTYVFTMDAQAIRIYLDGVLQETYVWKERDAQVMESNKAQYTADYNYSTLDFVNAVDYFNLGASCAYWGQPEMIVRDAAFYSQALTAEQAASVDAQYADFKQLRADLTQASWLDFSNYDTAAVGWQSAYDSYMTALDAAQKVNYFTATQQNVDDAVAELDEAKQTLDTFLRASDLTEGLVAAYPLSESGDNLVSGKTGKVLFMNGNATQEITSALTATKQRITGTRLFDESKLHPRDRWDMSATSTTGLKIPADAFDAGMTESGMTITVSVYAESLYNAWARIFQLGTRASGDGYASGTGVFVAYANGAARINHNDNSASEYDTYGDPFCTIIAGEWITVSIVFDSYSEKISFYVTSNTNGRLHDGKAASAAISFGDTSVYADVLSAVVNGEDNWIGRSYWNVDGNQVAYAANLTVYDRALSSNEIELLHGTTDLSDLIA